MKELEYKKVSDLQNGYKSMTINQHSEDKDCQTHVRKNFTYNVYKVAPETDTKNPNPPQVYITKSFDSKNRQEKFNFQVIGKFYLMHGREMMEVNFHHLLDIQLVWTKKDFSPKKSEVLTDKG